MSEQAPDINRPEPDPKRDPGTGRFGPGNNANPAGRPEGSLSLTATLRRIVNSRFNPKDPEDLRTHGEALIEAAIANAREGNASFFKEILDRLEGKVPEKVLTEYGPDWVVDYTTPPAAPAMAEESPAEAAPIEPCMAEAPPAPVPPVEAPAVEPPAEGGPT